MKSLSLLIATLFLASCTLFVDDETYELSSETEDIIHNGDGYDAPKTVIGEDFEITYQYQPNTRPLTDEIQSYITSVETDEMGWTYIIYFDKKTPEHLIPRKGEMITCVESEKFPDGLGAEVLSSGYEDDAYVVNAVYTTYDNIFKELNLNANINPAEAFVDDEGKPLDVKARWSPDRQKEEGDSDDDDGDYITDVDFGKDKDGYYMAFNIPVSFEHTISKNEKDNTEGKLSMDGDESLIKNKIRINLEMDGLNSQLTIKDTIDTDVTLHVNGTLTLADDKVLKKGKILPKPIKKTFLVITVILNLRYEITLSGKIEADGALRWINQGVLKINTDVVKMLKLANPYSVLGKLGVIKDIVKDTELTTNRWEFYTSFSSSLSIKASVIGYLSVLSKRTGVQLRPYLKGTITATQPPFSLGRFDLSRNHAAKFNLTAGIKLSAGIGGSIKEIIANLQEGYLSIAKDATRVMKKIQKAIKFGLDVYIASLPEEEQEEFKYALAQQGLDISAMALDELDKLLTCVEEEIKKQEKNGGKITTKSIGVSLDIFSGELDGISSSLYWFPKIADKYSKFQRQSVTEGKTQTYKGYISWSTKGILINTVGWTLYPCLDVYKVTEKGEVRFNVFNGYTSDKFNNLMEVSKNVSQEYTYFNVNGLEGNTTYKAYPCYSLIGGAEPKYYDKAIVLTTSLPTVVVTEIKDLDVSEIYTADDEWWECTFNAYLTVKGAKAMQKYSLNLYQEGKTNSLESYTENKNLTDVTNKEYKFKVKFPLSYKTFPMRLSITGTLKPDESSDGAKINPEGTTVTFHSVYFDLDPENETITVRQS